MTEYWVSQGNKWCDFCKIYIANNPASIRTHEFGQRHKDNVSKKLADIRKSNAAKEKETQQALKDMERIEAQAERSYQKDLKDLAAKERAAASSASSLDGDWFMDKASGYLYNAANGFYHDPKSGLYYSDNLGKWVPREEALKGGLESTSASSTGSISLGKGTLSLGQSIQAPKVKIKGKASSLQVGKRKPYERPGSISKNEMEALKAREAAKKRVQEREKGMMGLYQSF